MRLKYIARDDDSNGNTQEMRGVIDTDGDGELTKMEFIKNAMKCEFVCDMLTVGFEEDDDEEEDDDDGGGEEEEETRSIIRRSRRSRNEDEE